MVSPERIIYSPEHSEQDQELLSRIEYLNELIAQTDDSLAVIDPVVRAILIERHHLFTLEPQDPKYPEKGGSLLDPKQSIPDQLYPEPTYNGNYYESDLGLRQGGAVAFHHEKEKYNPSPDDTLFVQQQKFEYRQIILTPAQELGFVAKQPGEASNELDYRLKLTDSVLEPIDVPIEAVIIPGAAGLSDHVRFRGTIRDIESGAVHTDRIIMATCDRPVTPTEKITLATAGFSAGETEFELCQSAIGDLTDGFIEPPTESEIAVTLPSGTYPARLLSGKVFIGEQPIRIDILSAPYDPQRLLPDGKPAIRTNTEETFIAVGELLIKGRSTLLIESHDTWAPAQRVIAERIIGVNNNKQVLGTGALKSDRVITREDGSIDLNMAEAVIDEMTKYFKELVNTRIAANNKKTGLLK